ncbi:PD-(D/E)XK motif protein [Brevibacterium sp. UCMA 11752]|uniref:PD-(D/E)XK motif protein n=1 Tax=Brevibacterium sp. UCMA 11752 TaxID=2745946 RepID=UPI001F2B7168|nr:PD-(D/E)XK motif protein [Brevibacterium sp. UCMA 11752]MCF2586104.1 PD-(D/E)XK motif protein [Brevibacterium sp. UCMA 11752]
MTSGYERVEQAILRLRAAPVAEFDDEAVRVLIGPAGRTDDALLVRDHLGQIHLMTRLPKNREQFKVPLGRTLRATWIEVKGKNEDTRHLDVVCTDARLLRTFLSMIGEMLNRAAESGKSCLDELAEVLESWREALSRESREIDRKRAIGLFGELTILEALARKDPSRALSLWTGPSGNRHDFSRSNALEVKTLTQPGIPAVTIHGARQLDPPIGAKLHLVAFRVLENANGSSIAELNDRLIQLGIPRQKLVVTLNDEARLLEDVERQFLIEETYLYEVTDDFPGIRASRLDENALRGVDNISYVLHLDSCPGQRDTTMLDAILEEL